MERIIRQIIELEHTAQKMVEDARAEEARIISEGIEESNAIKEHITEMAENKINQLKNKNQYESDDRIIRIYETTAMNMRLMEENAEENQTLWENDIFNRIVGR